MIQSTRLFQHPTGALSQYLLSRKVQLKSDSRLHSFSRRRYHSLKNDSEITRAKTVVMHMPGREIENASYHPRGHLYQGNTTIKDAMDASKRLERLFNRLGIKVVRVHDVIKKNKDLLLDLAMNHLSYEKVGRGKIDPFYLSDDYKREVLRNKHNDELFDLVMKDVTIRLKAVRTNTGIKVEDTVIKDANSNLTFVRDQQIITNRGLIMGRLDSIREREVQLMKYMWKAMGINAMGLPNDKEFIVEGGDFYPITEDLSMIACGLRTTQKAIKYLLDNNMFGTRYVAVVKDEHDRNQDRMHLDTYFNVVDSSTCVLHEGIVTGKYERLVDVYQQHKGEYEKVKENVPFYDYLVDDLQWKVIPVPEQDQLEYMINFLNVGEAPDGVCDIITSNPGFSALLKRNDYEGKTRIHHLDYNAINQMYGSIRCSTQAIRGEDIPSDKQLAVCTNKVLMVPPDFFGYNEETAESNKFMNDTDLETDQVRRRARSEFDSVVSSLRENGIDVSIFPNNVPGTYDAVFPNNWFSTHIKQGQSYLFLYPLCAESRRPEKLPATVEALKKMTDKFYDLTQYENDPIPKYLESTGSIVIDKVNRVGYLAISERSDPTIASEWAKISEHRLFSFTAKCEGYPIYHTNVMMAVGEHWAVVCDECIPDLDEREKLINLLVMTEHEVITVTIEQMKNFCCNILELQGTKGKIIAMSDSAFNNFTMEQKRRLRKYARLVPSDISTIETLAGGSVRCMIAELFTNSN
eukprot:TRINITY_DN3367_c0_g1_i2.p1 TRINITY_DN3367_c0_g1~~TRINITY_DN3367_c0_g1_i2.p1  ORF type:complete len:747 (-),score=155.51 TRINITY_DN3367_c0_g1_i2:1177-3417(-)